MVTPSHAVEIPAWRMLCELINGGWLAAAIEVKLMAKAETNRTPAVWRHPSHWSVVTHRQCGEKLNQPFRGEGPRRTAHLAGLDDACKNSIFLEDK
jgi:hypothetical protein